jgi:hypothetical protein
MRKTGRWWRARLGIQKRKQKRQSRGSEMIFL